MSENQTTEVERLRAAVDPVMLANTEAQAGMLQALMAVFEQSGKSVDDVAESLGVDWWTADDTIAGRTDLTLTELRMLAYAIGARITYEVSNE